MTILRTHRRTRGLTGSAAAATPLLLDLITTQPLAAYSAGRKLKSTYAGSAIRIRRSSDSTEQDIGFSGSDLDTSSLSSFIGGGSGFFRTWYDQSGNSRDWGQSTAGNQPTYSSLQASLDGGDYMDLASALDHTSGHTIFVTSQVNDTATIKNILYPTSSGGLQIRQHNTENFQLVKQGLFVVLASSGTGYTAKNVHVFRSSSTINAIYVGGTSVGSNSGETYTNGINRLGAGNLGTDGFNGTMQEVIVYAGNLSNADINTIGANMANFAGTSWTNL